MRTRISLTALLLFVFYLSSFSQNLTVGFENGITWSNLYGDLYNGKWDSQPGQLNGFYTEYSFNDWFAIKTGLSYTTLYYKYISEQYYYFDDYFPASDYYYSSSAVQPSIYQPGNYSDRFWKLSFWRIPLLFQFKTPGRLSFKMGTGPYYSFFANDEFTGKDRDIYLDENSEGDVYPKTDWGWIFSTGLHYKVTSDIEVSVTGQTTRGKEVYIKDIKGKNGSAEMFFGFAYTFGAGNKSGRITTQESDSALSRIEILPHSGVIFSTSSNPDYKANYLTSAGFGSGLSVKYNIGRTFSLISGMWYERKGYQLNYNGEIQYLYIKPDEESANTFVDTNTGLDYLTFPFLFDFTFGNRFTVSMNFGFYYSLLQNAMVRGDYTYTILNSDSYSVQKKYIYDKVNGKFKKDDVGGIAGLRVSYPVLSQAKVFLGVNYSQGFNNVFKYNYSDNPSLGWNQKIINSSYSVSLGLIIPIFKTEMP